MKIRAALPVLVLSAWVLPAHAEQVALSYRSLASFAGPTYTTPGEGGGAVTVLPVPGAHIYGNSFGPVNEVIPGQSSEFYDAYVFTIESAIANVLNATISLDVPPVPGPELALASVQARLFALPNSSTFPWFSGPFDPPMIQAWSAPADAGIDLLVIDPVTLDAGTYVLQIRGNVAGSAGGAYSGVVNLAPVPLPAALPLLLSALGMLGLTMRSRRAG